MNLFFKITYDLTISYLVTFFLAILLAIYEGKILYLSFIIPIFITSGFYIFGIYKPQLNYTLRFRHKLIIGLIFLFFIIILTYSYIYKINFYLSLIFFNLYALFLLIPRLIVHFEQLHFEIQNLFRIKKKKSINLINSYKDKKSILIIGGAGYIGTELCKILLKKNFKVKILDKLKFRNEKILELSNNDNFSLIKGDASSYNDLINASQEVSTIVQLSGLVGDPACKINENLTWIENVVVNNNISLISDALKIPKVIFASSCSVYGLQDKKVNENSKLNPLSLYAKSKIESEKIFSKNFLHTKTIILRFATVYGLSDRMRFDLVVNKMTLDAIKKKKISVFNPNAYRPLIHVKDIAQGIYRTIENQNLKSNNIYNLGDNKDNFNLIYLANTVKETIEKNFNMKVDIEVNSNEDDNRSYNVDFALFEKEFNFSSSLKLDSGILEIAEFIINNNNHDFYSKEYNNYLFEKDINNFL